MATNPRRPQYGLASEIPLNLFDCQYDEIDGEGNRRTGEWVYDLTSLELASTLFEDEANKIA